MRSTSVGVSAGINKMDKGRDFFSNVFNGVIEGITVSAITGIKKTVEEASSNFTKARFGNMGSNDEYLFNSACTLALSRNLIDQINLSRVCTVFNSYSYEQRSRIIGIIGKTESEIIYERDRLDAAENVVYDKKGKPSKEKTTTKGNFQGAEMIGAFGKMTDDEIHNYLAASGMSVTTISQVKESVKKTAEKIEHSQFKADGDSFFTRPSALERLCNRLGI